MSLAMWKAKVKAKTEAADEFAAQVMDRQGDLWEGRIRKYMQIVGLGLIGGAIVLAVDGHWVPALICFCTFHIHVIVNYRFKKLIGVPTWNLTTKPEPVEDANGAK